MAAATAAETLHRAFNGTAATETALPEADFALLRERIAAAVSATLAEHPHLREHDQPVLGLFHNRRRGPTLHTRLLGPLDMLGAQARPLLIGNYTTASQEHLRSAEPPSNSRQARACAQATKRVRNGIAHGGRASDIGRQAAYTVLLVTTAVVELLVLRELGIDEQHLADLVRNHHYLMADRVRRDLVPLLDDDVAAPEPEPSPLIAALLEAVAGAWPKTGWVDWAAFAGAVRRHKALPEAPTHHVLVEALHDELGTYALAPTPESRAEARVERDDVVHRPQRPPHHRGALSDGLVETPPAAAPHPAGTSRTDQSDTQRGARRSAASRADRNRTRPAHGAGR